MLYAEVIFSLHFSLILKKMVTEGNDRCFEELVFNKSKNKRLSTVVCMLTNFALCVLRNPLLKLKMASMKALKKNTEFLN